MPSHNPPTLNRSVIRQVEKLCLYLAQKNVEYTISISPEGVNAEFIWTKTAPSFDPEPVAQMPAEDDAMMATLPRHRRETIRLSSDNPTNGRVQLTNDLDSIRGRIQASFDTEGFATEYAEIEPDIGPAQRHNDLASVPAGRGGTVSWGR